MKTKFNKGPLLVVILLILLILFFLRLNSSIVGKATAGTNITILSISSLNFTVNSINFGSGSVYYDSSNATIDTKGNVSGGNWSATTDGFVVENIGNTNLKVYLGSGKTALEFLGGTSPGYFFMISDEEIGSCVEKTDAFQAWTAVNTTGSGTEICSSMNFSGESDTIRIDIKLAIPSDALIGERTDIFTVTGVGL